LHRNNFSGELPASLANLKKLQNLVLFENNLSGPIFDIVVQLPKLSSLSVDNNNFTDEIPKNILDATNLNSIDLSHNNFFGDIPGLFADQSFYNYLRLNDNDFSGCLDPALYVFCGNDKVDFSNNQKLPWKGDLNEYCMTSGSEADQIGAPCNDINLLVETITEDCACLPSCDHPDFIGLMSLYSSTKGSGWHKKNGWKEGAAGNNCDPCSWEGIDCNSDGRVVSLGLINNNLKGSLPSEIDQLTELQYLALSSNNIGGQLPETIFNLTQLKELKLASNNFYGSISENLGNLVNLTNFSLSNCNITGSIPSTIGNLTELTILSLTSNEISGELPPEVTNLTKLEFLSLELNHISGPLPEDIGNMSSLKSLRLFSNDFSGTVPASLGDLENLFILYLQNNNLSGCFDPNLLSLCSVGELRFSNNIDLAWGGEFDKFCETSGDIDEQEGAFCGLGGSGIINECECIKSSEICFTPEGLLCKEWVQELIAELDCYDFGFGQRANFNLAVSNYKEDPVLVVLGGGEFASKVYSFQSVYTCEGELLETCSYSLGSGCIDSVTIYSQLIPAPTTFYYCMEDVLPDCSMFVQHPDFSALTEFFYSTGGLQWVNNDGWRSGVQNPFSDPCDNWNGVTCNDDGRVISIELENNELTGIIPSSIDQLHMLQRLNLNSNELSGNIIESISNLPEITFLSLSDNQFSGPLASEIGNLQKLTVLNLGKNKFTGSLPLEISNCTQLKTILLDENEFTGGIPTSYTQLLDLEILKIDDNDLSGCIPSVYYDICSIEVTAHNNLKLPWSGDLSEFCATSGTHNEQVGTPCNDGDNSNGINDNIQEDCSCAPESVSTDDPDINLLSIYPNPTVDYLFVSGLIEGEIKFRLINIIGRIMKDGTLISNQIDLKDLSQGIYLLELYHPNSERKELYKVIKE
jgi:Leucine-rich repeat (LRR) protein